VNPESAEKYRGMTDAEGKTFPIKSIDISDRNGNKETVALKGQAATPQSIGDLDRRAQADRRILGPRAGSGRRPEDVTSAETAATTTPNSTDSEKTGGRGVPPEQTQGALTKGARVTFTDLTGKERTGVLAHAGDRIARVKADDDRKSYEVAVGKVKATGETLGKQRLRELLAAGTKTGATQPAPPEGSEVTAHAGSAVEGDTGAESEEALRGPGPQRAPDTDTEYLHGGIGAVIPTRLIARAAKPVLDMIGIPEEYGKVRASRDLQTSLYELDSQANGNVLRAERLMEESPGTAADNEALYHYQEDPTLPLTATQRELLDDYVAPLVQDAAQKATLMHEDGVTIENYVHRMVIGRGNFIDRLFAGSKTTGKGNLLRKNIPSQKSRTMMALEPATGSRQVVSIKGDRVTQFRKGQEPRDMGPLSSGLTTKLEQLDARLETVVRDILKNQEEIGEVQRRDKEEYLSGLQQKIDQMKRDRDLVGEVKGRTPGQQSTYGVEVSFNKRASLSRQIEKAEKELEAYKGGRAEVQLSNRAKERIRRINETLGVLRNQRGRLLEQVPTERMADHVWEDKNGKTWKITQATTKEIEGATDLRYYHSAIGSAVINWLAVEKQFRALQFLKEFTENPEFSKVGLKIDGGRMAPEGWRTTQLPQLRNYYFEPHTAEVLDWYNDRLKAREPGILEKVSNFLVSSIFFNPAVHVPNIAIHFAAEKGVSGAVDPRVKPGQMRAAIKAINAVWHQNDDFLAALDAGAPLQSQQFAIHQYSKIFLDKMQQELAADPTPWARVAKALGYLNPLKLMDAVKAVSGHVTWYSNDIAFLQAAYEKVERGMDLKSALRETGKHIPDYRLPTRIFDSAALAKVLGNTNIVMFMHYHYGALRSYGEALKSLAGIDWRRDQARGDRPSGEAENAAGRTVDEEKLHGLDILAMIGLITFAVYPEIEKLLRKLSGNENLHLRRAGASTLPYNLLQMARGEELPADALQAIVTPNVMTKAAVELGTNRDVRTGRHIYTYPVRDWEDFGEQVGSRAARTFSPADQLARARSTEGGWKKQALGMVGVTFPEHGAMKIASEIAAADSASHAFTPEESHRMQARYEAIDALREGNADKAEKLMEEAHLTREQRHNLMKTASEDPLLAKVQEFSAEELQQVYHHATPEERLTLEPLLERKVEKLSAEELQQVYRHATPEERSTLEPLLLEKAEELSAEELQQVYDHATPEERLTLEPLLEAARKQGRELTEQ
jgi:hypothetical protein